MGTKTEIGWTDSTWNPMSGCRKVSQGCKNCYAERMAKRFSGAFKYKFHSERLNNAGQWKSPRKVFVCSMSDLFQAEATDTQIRQVFEAMGSAPQHTYQVLTKRIDRVLRWYRKRPGGLFWPSNVWLGTSVENQEVARFRIPFLLASPAETKFLSVEPLLGPVSIAQWIPGGIDWVIVGGESGPKARPMFPDWARVIRDECRAAEIPFFFKQWGGKRPKDGGDVLDGKTWHQIPEKEGAG